MPGHASVPFKMRYCVPNGLIDTIMLECHPWVWWETARCTGAVQSCKKSATKQSASQPGACTLTIVAGLY